MWNFQAFWCCHQIYVTPFNQRLPKCNLKIELLLVCKMRLIDATVRLLLNSLLVERKIDQPPHEKVFFTVIVITWFVFMPNISLSCYELILETVGCMETCFNFRFMTVIWSHNIWQFSRIGKPTNLRSRSRVWEKWKSFCYVLDVNHEFEYFS